MYQFSRRFWSDMTLRISGPGGFRFIIQPLVAIILGIRDGLHDAEAGKPPYVIGILFHPELRREMWQTALASILKPVVFAVVLDAVLQYFILGRIYLGEAIIIGIFLMAVPYILARGATNRIATRYHHRRRRPDAAQGT